MQQQPKWQRKKDQNNENYGSHKQYLSRMWQA